jgi:hypothetical protein
VLLQGLSKWLVRKARGAERIPDLGQQQSVIDNLDPTSTRKATTETRENRLRSDIDQTSLFDLHPPQKVRDILTKYSVSSVGGISRIVSCQ